MIVKPPEALWFVILVHINKMDLICLTTRKYSFSVLKDRKFISFHACVIGKFHPECLSACFGSNFLLSGQLIGEPLVFKVMWYHLSRPLHLSAFLFCLSLSHWTLNSLWNQTLASFPLYHKGTLRLAAVLFSKWRHLHSCICQYHTMKKRNKLWCLEHVQSTDFIKLFP